MEKIKTLNSKEMGKRIKQRRISLNISRDELAKRLSVSPKTIENIENGEKGTTLSRLYQIKQILGVSVDYLMDGDKAFETGDEKRQMINENIMSSLSVCSVKQLGCMEKMARLYVEGVVNEK